MALVTTLAHPAGRWRRNASLTVIGRLGIRRSAASSDPLNRIWQERAVIPAAACMRREGTWSSWDRAEATPSSTMTSARLKRSGSSPSRVLRCSVTASARSVRASKGSQWGPRGGTDEVSAMSCIHDLFQAGVVGPVRCYWGCCCYQGCCRGGSAAVRGRADEPAEPDEPVHLADDPVIGDDNQR